MLKNFEYINDGSQGITIREHGRAAAPLYQRGFNPRGSKNALKLVVRLNK